MLGYTAGMNLERAQTWASKAVNTAGIQIGATAETIFRLRHRYRLRHTGHLQGGASLTTLGTGDFPVREGNDVRVLIDGDAAFAAMAEAIDSAERTVHITGWTADPSFVMERGARRRTLGDVLREASQRGVETRVLLWRGAPLPMIHPSRGDGTRSEKAFNAIPGVTCMLDAHEYILDCHHEKLVIVDDQVAFLGGLDLTDLKSDRWDTSEHIPRDSDGWHDAAVRTTGPVVADVVHHFSQRWAEVAFESLPVPETPAPTGTVSTQFVRTIPEKVYNFAPHGDFGALGAYLEALNSAETYIYLENQFLWAVEIIDVLVDKLRRPPSDLFRLVILLPTRAHTGQDATLGQVSRLRKADKDNRLLVLTVESEQPDHQVYVHAKVGVIDDQWLTVGSVNLNTHSLFNDTEANLVIFDADVARATREDLFREHVGQDPEGMDPVHFIDTVLRPVAEEQERRVAAGQPPTARVRTMVESARRTDLLRGPISSLLVDG